MPMWDQHVPRLLGPLPDESYEQLRFDASNVDDSAVSYSTSSSILAS